MNPDTLQHSFWQVAKRGIEQHCPKCGQGKLFTGYLTQVQSCSVCGEALGTIRADDGPAWLTIIITGHILAPLLLTIAPRVDWPNWLAMGVWISAAMILMAIILPRAKGFFISMIWRSKQRTRS